MLSILMQSSTAKTLFIVGNSLSRHAPAENLGWHFDHGMAASSPENDYAHLLKGKLEMATGKSFNLIIERPEGEHSLIGLPKAMPEKADVVILQIGDNYKNQLEPAEALRRYRALLSSLKKSYPSAAMVAVGPWKCSYNDMMRSCAAAEGVAFADILQFGKDPAMSARGFSSWAVNWHPGDRGMAAIADKVWEQLAPQLDDLGYADLHTGVVPEVQKVESLTGDPFILGRGMGFHAPGDASEPLRHLLPLIADECEVHLGIPVTVKYDLPAGSRKITLAATGAEVRFLDAPEQGYDAYALHVHAEGIALSAAGQGDGLYYGLQTLRQILVGTGKIPPLAIRDWANQRWRIVYLGRAEPEWICAKLSRMKINMAIVESYWNGHQNWWFRPVGENRAMAEKFIAVARKNNIEVAPLVQGGGWAYGVADRDPHCCEGVWVRDAKVKLGHEPVPFPNPNVIVTSAMPILVRSEDGKTCYKEGVDYEIVRGVTRRQFKEDHAPWKLRVLPDGKLKAGMIVSLDYNYVPYSPHQSPYCPSEPRTYEILAEVLKNVVEIYHPRFIHIGHDEVIRRNSDRRCIERNMSRVELAAEDLKWWHSTIKKLDPEITIMMWDDMMRHNVDNGELLDKIPQDIIICPWVYYQGKVARTAIAERLDWFLGQNHRTIIGTASGYFLGNTLLWRDELERYSGDPKNLGFMFSHWGESPALWGTLPFTANYMWSSNRPSAEHYAALNRIESGMGKFGLRGALEFSIQRQGMAKKINAGENRLGEIRAFLRTHEPSVLGGLVKGIETLDNPFPEALLAQSHRLADYYEAMLLARKLQSKPEPQAAERYFALLEKLEPTRKAEWNEARKKYASDKKIPSSETVFGVEILPEPALDEGGMHLRIAPVSVKDELGLRRCEFSDAIPLAGMRMEAAAPGMYTLAGSVDGEKFKKLGETTIGADGKGHVTFPPEMLRYVQIASTEPNAKISAETHFSLFKASPRYSKSLLQADCFLTPEWTAATWPTRATMQCTADTLEIAFDVTEKPGRKPVTGNTAEALHEDDCVQFFLREKPGASGFLQVIVNCEGQTQVKAMNGRTGKLPSCKTTLKKSTASGDWRIEMSLPLAELQGDPEQWAVNFTRNMPGVELSSYAALPATAFWFLQPEHFVGN